MGTLYDHENQARDYFGLYVRTFENPMVLFSLIVMEEPSNQQWKDTLMRCKQVEKPCIVECVYSDDIKDPLQMALNKL